LAELVDAVEGAAEEFVALDVQQALAGVLEGALHFAGETEAGGVEGGGGGAPMLGGDLCGFGGGVGVVVGDEVGDGDVDLVADAGDDGNARVRDGAGEDFLVEFPEVFEGAAAAG